VTRLLSYCYENKIRKNLAQKQGFSHSAGVINGKIEYEPKPNLYMSSIKERINLALELTGHSQRDLAKLMGKSSP